MATDPAPPADSASDSENSETQDRDQLSSEEDSGPSELDYDDLLASGSDDEDIYTVERVVDKRRSGGRVQYLVKWLNYADEDNTWEPVENILDQSIINEYEEAANGSGPSSRGRAAARAAAPAQPPARSSP